MVILQAQAQQHVQSVLQADMLLLQILHAVSALQANFPLAEWRLVLSAHLADIRTLEPHLVSFAEEDIILQQERRDV